MIIYKLNKTKGFTLIELLVAMSIVSIISITFFTLISTTIKGNKKNEIDIKSMQIAQTHIENIRNQLKKEGKLDKLTLKYSEDVEGNIKEETIDLEDNSKFDIYRKFNHKSIDKSIHIIEVLITREKGSADKYLYNINVKVTTKLSKKKTIITTSILDS